MDSAVQSSRRETDMTAKQALFDAAFAACQQIDSREDSEARKARDIDALMAVQNEAYTQAQAAFRLAMQDLIDAAYAGDAFAKGWVETAFGDLGFDPDGEEFGHYRTLPADKNVAIERMQAVTPVKARNALRAIAEES